MATGVRATPEKKAAVLADYRSKKMTSPTALAKAHGLSRSSVYRILQSAQHQSEVEAARVTAPQTQAAAPNTGLRAAIAKGGDAQSDSESDDDGQESQMSGNFFFRSSRFADDLGLADTTGGRREVMDKNESAEENEEKLEEAMNRIASFGNGGNDIVDGPPMPPSRLLDEIMSDGPVGLAVSRKSQARTEAPAAPPEPFIDRADVTQRIIFNVEHFGTILKPVVGPSPQDFIASLAAKSDRELKSLLTTLERTRSVGNIAAGFKQTFYVLGQATEATSRFIGMKSEGFTERLRQQDEELTMIMKEIAMDQWERVKAMDRPEMRLGLMFCMTLVQTDAHNRMREQVERVRAGRVAPGVVEAHTDL